MINSLTKSNLRGGKGLFHFIVCSLLSREVRPGPQGRNLEAEDDAETMEEHSLLAAFFFTEPRTTSLGFSTTNSELDPPTSVIYDGGIFLTKSLPSQLYLSLCQTDKTWLSWGGDSGEDR